MCTCCYRVCQVFNLMGNIGACMFSNCIYHLGMLTYNEARCVYHEGTGTWTYIYTWLTSN